MSWFRLSSIIFAFWALLFGLLPRFTNEFAALRYTTSRHAEDWTQLVGLLSLGYSVLLHQAHRSSSGEVRRIVALAVLATTLPCALLMTYWQLVPDPRWTRLDILNIAVLCVMSLGMAVELRALSQGTSSRRRGWMMRTTLNLDGEALASAMKVSPDKTKTDVINEALREYARRNRLRELLQFEGKVRWEGDLDKLRRRSQEA